MKGINPIEVGYPEEDKIYYLKWIDDVINVYNMISFHIDRFEYEKNKKPYIRQEFRTEWKFLPEGGGFLEQNEDLMTLYIFIKLEIEKFWRDNASHS